MRKTALILITSLLLATGLQGQSRKRGRDATRDPAVNVVLLSAHCQKRKRR